jgi:hypothetical protein
MVIRLLLDNYTEIVHSYQTGSGDSVAQSESFVNKYH